jgi:basic amino acid/polyamine antiporter, APA family
MPVFPIIGVLLCVYLTIDLPRDAWLLFVVWLVAGLLIYAFSSRKHSRRARAREGVRSGA